MSSFEGTIIDAVGRQPLGGVTVTATSPVLSGEQSVATNAQGFYMIPDLPPGYYALRCELDGFRPFERDDIELHVDRTIRINAELLPDSVGAAAVNS